MLATLVTMQARYNTPNMDAPVAFSSGRNLRDSTVEDNVRKRPFSDKILDPPARSGLSKSLQK